MLTLLRIAAVFTVIVIALVAMVVMALCAPAAHASDIKGGFVVNIDLTTLIRTLVRHVGDRDACSISTVGYRYTGQPGQTVEYAGERYEIGQSGNVELIATRRDARRLDEPVDQFGFADRELPMPRVRPRR